MLPTTMPALADGHVSLRPFNESDAALVQSVATDPLIPLITTVSACGKPEAALAYITRQNDRLANGTGYSFAISAAPSGQATGQIGLWLKNIDQGRASTGYWIAQRFRRCGYARSALSLLADWALALPEVQRLELYVEPWNEGSWKAAEACGFEREGLLRSWQPVGGIRKDMYMYSRLA